MKKMGIVVLSALVLAVVAFPQQALYDVVIHDGMIVDGTGNPWYRADIGIAGGRIQKIGTIPPSAGRKAINASGKAVSPGFIDLHTHSDIPVLVDGTAQSAVRQGVTLDVIGESASVAPLEGVVLEEFKKEQKRQFNFDVDWTTVSGYVQRLQKQGVSINIAISVAPQQIKRAVIGYQNRPATPQEIVRMKRLVEQAMLEGAVGLSSAFNGGGYDNPEEMFEMAAVAAQYGGYYATHVGSEGYQLTEEIKKAIQVSEVTHIPIHGLPHPRSFGTNPRVLGKYVREERVILLEDAVRKMTSLPAQIMRLKDRGMLREGYWADIVVFDPKMVKDVATFEKPKQYPAGIEHVLVNGIVVVESGNHTGAKPGKAILGPGFRE